MSGHDLAAEKRKYKIIFGTLIIFTIITVAVSKVHLPFALTVIVALAIATFKASLVACYFMHLISEQKLVYCILGFTGIFFASLMFLTLHQETDKITGTHVHNEQPNIVKEAHYVH